MGDVDESGWAKFIRKFKAEPFVPIGCLLTAAVLTRGIWAFKQGNVVVQQQMMRYRVFAQLGTCGALGYGAYEATKNQKPFDDTEYQGNLGPASK